MRKYLEIIKQKIREIIDCISRAIKMLVKISKWLINTIMILIFIIVPFLYNVLDSRIAQLVWYPSCVFYIISSIYDYFKTKDSDEDQILIFMKNFGALWMLPIFTSVFVFNYYDIDYLWLWIIFILAALLLPFSLYLIFKYDWKHNTRTEEEYKKAFQNLLKYIVQFWLYDLFYLSVFNEWLLLTYLFGIIAMVIIFLNLAKAFIQGMESLQILLGFDFILGVGLSIYLIYIIPDSILQSIVVNIVAAVYGGILTLVGVAWTIKKGEDDKKETFRLNCKPWLFVQKSVSWEKRIDYTKCYFASTEDIEIDAQHFCVLKNTDNGITILKRITSKQYDYFPLNDSIIDKKGVVDIMVYFEPDDNKEDLEIIVEDVLGYEYVYKILMDKFSKVVQGLKEVQFNE